MGPGQAGTWNKVSAPTHSGNHVAKPEMGSSRPSAKYLPSREASGDVDKMGTHTSESSSQKIGRGNVKKSKLMTPGGDDMGAAPYVWGGRGMGGY